MGSIFKLDHDQICQLIDSNFFVMPNRRSRRNQTFPFFCPYCQQRLWRLGYTKHYIFYKNATEIKENTGISTKKSKLLNLQNNTYLDNKKWIEALCCSEHGRLWLLISRQEKTYEYRLAKETDWLRTNKTIDPRNPNPSVSEFTQKMSLKPSIR